VPGGGSGNANSPDGKPGQVVETTVVTTPGASITYAIGAGGTGNYNAGGNAGGSTTFTGATTAAGGTGAHGAAGPAGEGANNQGGGFGASGGTGGSGGQGKIELEYWV